MVIFFLETPTDTGEQIPVPFELRSNSACFLSGHSSSLRILKPYPDTGPDPYFQEETDQRLSHRTWTDREPSLECRKLKHQERIY